MLCHNPSMCARTRPRTLLHPLKTHWRRQASSRTCAHMHVRTFSVGKTHAEACAYMHANTKAHTGVDKGISGHACERAYTNPIVYTHTHDDQKLSHDLRSWHRRERLSISSPFSSSTSVISLSSSFSPSICPFNCATTSFGLAITSSTSSFRASVISTSCPSLAVSAERKTARIRVAQFSNSSLQISDSLIE